MRPRKAILRKRRWRKFTTGYVLPPDIYNFKRPDMTSIPENQRVYLTPQQMNILKKNGFNPADNLYFPCHGKDGSVMNNWEDVVEYMVRTKMDKAGA